MGNVTVRRRHSALAAGLATLAMTLSLAAPAQARTVQDYVALGDSYAAGIGGGAYVVEDCVRSANAYSELADDLKSVMEVTNVACGGATTQQVVQTQLALLDKKTDLVTITAGGNNLGFGTLAAACGPALIDPAAGAACFGAITDAQAQIASGALYQDLVEMIGAVQDAAPKAEIVVTGYPYLFDPVPFDPTNPTSVFISQANLLVFELNATIKAAALATGAEYVDVTDEFAGHGINLSSNDSWINFDPTALDSFENLHPNAEGYEAYFDAIYSEGFYN
ncbi:lysophospholipase L1-like esterase [Arthrobacter sp. SLBN-100]|uniref:SGNH/GDSL hydrolase family protein n=1 Tax=Arthrobacter sp. SLBN-100 TaxID=2768450 RepID=UPI0011503C8A|nr:SGNH/GDSL hydrolase family protein [Arthrobacter sp. SLBN-100]TQJ67848.1 lysophospholipase L1-like esterase [Arthrobacter sp. SLBN-100]